MRRDRLKMLARVFLGKNLPSREVLDCPPAVCYSPAPLGVRLAPSLWIRPMSVCAVLRRLIPIGLLALSGCQNFDLSSLPLADKLGFATRAPVPPEVAARYGPTLRVRLEKIKRQGIAAAKASPTEQEEIARALAAQIQQESNPVLRQEIVKSIANCKNPLAELVIRAGLNDKNRDVQIESCRAWGERRSAESVPILSQVLRNEDADLDVKLAAVTALANSGNEEAVAVLSVALAKGADPALQHQAVLALQELTDRDFGNDLVAWRNFVDHDNEEPSPANEGAATSVVKWPFSWWQ
jgi:HEAT repeat protein